MKRFKNIYKAACMLGLIAITTTSCEDWLTIYPQNKIVEEEFWEDKNDLEGVRYGAYKQMASTISKLALWGDLRSDTYNMNVTENSAQSNRDTYDEITKAMPDSSMSQFDWGSIYTTINYCNKVLQHGEEVLEKDKQFTRTEWIQIRAEMTALRALNYFYLIRAFKDVPYSTKVINTDAEVENFGLTNQMIVLDSCITDCERVAGQARNRFTDLKDTKGMITNTAIYAMLADMYLWRASLHEGRTGDKNYQDSIVADGVVTLHTVTGDYQKAAEYADQSLAALASQNEEEQNSTFNHSITETINFGLTNCDMIKNDFDGAYQNTTPELEAQKAIFDEGNSVESIFELQFSQSDSRKNGVVDSLYGYSDGAEMMVSQEAISKVYGSWGTDAEYDSRTWTNCTNLINTGSTSSSTSALPGYYCVKYMTPEIVMDGTNTSREIKYAKVETDSYRNWIIYRMTDVMLMKAEALLCINATDKDAQDIVNAIHRRSYCNYNKAELITENLRGTSTADKVGNAVWSGDLKSEKGATIKGYMVTLMRERQIELLGEGKRWFDLVRLAERCSYNESDKGDAREDNPDANEAGDMEQRNTIRAQFGLPALEEGKHVPNGLTGVATICELFMKNAYSSYWTTLKNRMKNRYGLYCPIYYMEVKASEGAIQQNPVWNKSKYAQNED